MRSLSAAATCEAPPNHNHANPASKNFQNSPVVIVYAWILLIKPGVKIVGPISVSVTWVSAFYDDRLGGGAPIFFLLLPRRWRRNDSNRSVRPMP